jgi:hypothetical protein
MELIVQADGSLRCLYDETVDLSAVGQVTIRRASHVEPTEQGQWQADLSPVGGPVLGPFMLRSEALAAEVEWLRRHWLLTGDARA